MRPLLSLLLLGGCFGAGDGIHIGKATGAYKKWDTAACSCAIEQDSFYGPAISLGCMPMFTGEASTTLYVGIPAERNVVSRVNAVDFYADAVFGVALVELSSEDPEAVWIDALTIPDQGGLEDVRMFCEGL